jgi:ABC-type oligopeptide transport system ATPase subunit
MNPLLKVQNLRKTYTSRNFMGQEKFVHAVQGVSFEVFPSETFALVGESGCGKSTIAKMLMKIEKPTEGQIFIEGKDLSEIPQKELSSYIQMIFQDPYSSLNPRKKIKSSIAEPLVVRGELSLQDIEQLVSQTALQVGLREEVLERYPHMLSGGQRQRVGIARALITKPKLIVCDEPVSALDVSVQAQVLNLFLDIQQKMKVSLLFISHDLSVVKFLAHRVAVMNKGQLVESQATQDLFLRPQNEYTRQLLEATYKL